MSEIETTRVAKPESTASAAPKASFTDTVVELGLSWAEAGVGIGKTALEHSARALDRTAQCLSSFQERLKGSVSPAAADEPAIKGSQKAAEAELPSA